MFKISTEQINALLQNLGRRPYQEVAQLVAMLRSLDKVEGEPEAEVKTETPKK